MLNRYLPRESFASYEDFLENFQIAVPEQFNFAVDVIDGWAAEKPDKPALVWCNDAGDERRFSFGDISRLSARAAAALAGIGVGRGDVVLLLLKRRWQFWVLAPAIMRLGAIFIPATTQLTRKDLVYRCEAATVKTVITITEPDITAALAEALPDCHSVQSVCYVQSDPRATALEKPFAPPAGWFDWNRLTAEVSADSAAAYVQDRFKGASGEDPMLIYFTSGTTGMPKMVLHNYNHPLGHIITAHYWQQLGEDGLHIRVADTGWAKCGWGKIYGQWICGVANFVYDMDRFDALKLLEKIAAYRVTSFCAPPTIYRYMIHEDFSQYDLSALKMALTAGEPLNPEVFNRFKQGTDLSIYEGFGQTEGVVLCANYPWFPPKPGSIGKPSPLYDIDIIDDDGESCPPGTEGRIVVRGLDRRVPPGLFRGYYRDPEATAKVWHDGIYETGDVAWRDEEGYYWFVGRSDDVIKCSGYRIGPFEVESALQAHRAVLECAVTAAPDPMRGQVVKATIVLAKGWQPSPELIKELQDHVKHTTAPYKYPRIIEFVDALPKTISGKIRRVEIRAKDDAGAK